MNMKKLILLLSLAMMVVAVAAQPGGDPNGGGKPGVAPISGIEWLMLGGGLFGAIKSYFKFKSRKPGT